ncbi:MAG: peptidoglycan DD-metalloendopeptidase family protein [Defluviitaleaceae bacterium]|nr:peptidoglycan DD-metalloendopeptidase family protein [Defluviitaleaceae bacterium]
MKKLSLKKLSLLVISIIIFLTSTAASPALREELRELERQRAAAGQQVSEQANLLAGTEYAMSQIVAEMQVLDQQIVDANEVLEAIQVDLLATELRIAETEEDLAAARAERDAQSALLRGRMRVMYEEGTVGLLEVLFQAESITDFFVRWDFIRTAAQFDRDLLTSLETSENRVAGNLSELSRSRALITTLESEQASAIVEIERQMHERNLFFATLEEDAARHAEWLAVLEEEARVVNLEFGVVQQRVRAYEAEAARIAREERERQQAAEAAARAAERAAVVAELGSIGTFVWPLAIRGTISSPFGYRPDPFTNRNLFHTGIDVSAPANTHIFAAEAGIVQFAGWSAGWGNYIIIQHADGYATMYAHNTRNRVSTGDRVTRGQHIGDVGTTGRSTGNHLHFEIRRNGTYVDPMRYF